MDHAKSGLPDFARFKYASRVNPTCVVKPGGDGSRRKIVSEQSCGPASAGCAFFLFSSCLLLLSRASSADPIVAARNRFPFSSCGLRGNCRHQVVPGVLFFSCYLQERRTPAATRAPPTKAALILPAWVSNCAAVLPRGSIPSCFRAPVPPEARSGPFPATLAGAVAIWCRRPNACTLARTRGILWGMRPWRALRGGQAGARPVSQPPAPACEPLPVMKVKISRRRPLR